MFFTRVRCRDQGRAAEIPEFGPLGGENLLRFDVAQFSAACGLPPDRRVRIHHRAQDVQDAGSAWPGAGIEITG